ncbi:unnamed protein product [Soboliphyme baturini]|uniref:Uncharacterized protein n=1 Tax=Soboliphyme baturini TaxID=241478 RepID=A0A183J4T1_9BILA|nr:unnamed protein product [Soboliphyme baturini]
MKRSTEFNALPSDIDKKCLRPWIFTETLTLKMHAKRNNVKQSNRIESNRITDPVAVFIRLLVCAITVLRRFVWAASGETP